MIEGCNRFEKDDANLPKGDLMRTETIFSQVIFMSPSNLIEQLAK